MSPKTTEHQFLERWPPEARNATVAMCQSAALVDFHERAAWDAQSKFIDELREAVRG